MGEDEVSENENKDEERGIRKVRQMSPIYMLQCLLHDALSAQKKNLDMKKERKL